jgi:hypothetical protein
LQEEEEIRNEKPRRNLSVAGLLDVRHLVILFFAARPPGAKLLLLRHKPIHFFCTRFCKTAKWE